MVIFILLTQVSSACSQLLRDEVLYLSAIEEPCGYAKQEFDSTHLPALLPVYLHCARECGLPIVAAGRAAMLICGLVFIFSVYLTARLLWNDQFLALISFYISIFHYYVVYSSVHILRDGPYLSFFALILTCITAGFSITERKWRNAALFAAFALAPLGVALRREGLELFFILWLTVLMDCIFERKNRDIVIWNLLIAISGTLFAFLELVCLSRLFVHYGFDWGIIKACLHRLDYVNRVWKIL